MAELNGTGIVMLAPPADSVPDLLSEHQNEADADPSDQTTARLVDRLLRARHRFGITRVGSITRLDRIGIPVVQAVRPFSLSNAVSQGKGLTLDRAAASALVEALETWAAERMPQHRLWIANASTVGTAACDLYTAWTDPAFGDWRRAPMLWSDGWDLLEARRVPVPAALVDTAYTVPSPHPPIFPRTTTGLGGGATLRAAVLKAATEILERHVLTLARLDPRFLDECRIDPESVTGGAANDVLKAVRAAGVLAGIWRVPGCRSFPIYWCHLMEEPDGGALVPLPAEGSACDSTEDGALSKALIEACQARLTAISGAREDVTRRSYPRSYDRPQLEQWAEELRKPVRAGPIPAQGALPPADTQVPKVLAALREAGARAAIVVPLFSDDELGLHIVRMIAPPLQHGGAH